MSKVRKNGDRWLEEVYNIKPFSIGRLAVRSSLEMSEGKRGKLDEFLAYLGVDGGWHSLDDVSKAIQVAKDKVLMVARFFAKFGFVEFDRKAGRVKIDQKIRKWYTEEEPK